jgi:hypothetical protein
MPSPIVVTKILFSLPAGFRWRRVQATGIAGELSGWVAVVPASFFTVSAGASVGVGTVVAVSVIGAGVVLSAAGEVLCFIPNELGRALLHNEKVTN